MKTTQNIDNSPTVEILAFAVKELTKDWNETEQEEFSKYCFDTVCKDRFIKRKKFPQMTLQHIKQ